MITFWKQKVSSERNVTTDIYVYFKILQLKILADFDAYGYNWKNSITWVNEYTTYFLKFDIEDCFIVAWLLYLDTFGKNVNSL